MNWMMQGGNQPMGPQMPEAYTQNRMADWGMPAVAQIGEALFDQYRQNRFNKQHGIEGDEMTLNTINDSTKAQVDAPSQGVVGQGSPDGGDYKWAAEDTVLQAFLKSMVGV